MLNKISIKKKSESTSPEEYEVGTFTPKKITLSGDLLRRQYEEELRKKYCNPKTKSGEMK